MQRPFMLAFYLKSLQPLYGLSRSFVARSLVRSLAGQKYHISHWGGKYNRSLTRSLTSSVCTQKMLRMLDILPYFVQNKLGSE